MYTLDTNAIIYYIKEDPHAYPLLEDVLHDPSCTIYVSTVTEVELFSFPTLSAEEATLIEENVLQTVSLISLDSQIARIAGQIRAAYKLKLPDSVIAATALFTGSTLLTRNHRDFTRVPMLHIGDV
jgi:predicted nucleic acid-binding protein